VINEDLELKYRQYSENLKRAFSSLHLPETVEEEKAEEIVKLAEAYFKDSEYFKNMNMKVTALISMAYSEGLLDALRLLNLASFKWREKENVR
jgi:FAD synthetase